MAEFLTVMRGDRMNILNKGFTCNEFSIQLEDWEGDFMIGAYPKGGWRNRFRSQCGFCDKAEAQRAFEELLNGSKTVFDFDFTVMIPGGNRVPITDIELKRA